MHDAYLIVYLISYLSEFLFFYKVLEIYELKRYKNANLFLCVWMIIFSLIYYSTYGTDIQLNVMGTYITFMVFCTILYKGWILEKIYHLVFGLTIIKVWELMFAFFNNVLFQYIIPITYSEFVLYFMLLMELPILYIAYVYLKKLKIDTSNFSRRDWIIFLLIAITTFFFIFYVVNVMPEIIADDLLAWVLIEYTLVLFIILMYFLSYILLRLLTKKNRTINETTIRLQTEEFNQKLHDEIISANEINRKLRHDLKHHIVVIENMIQDNPNEAISYIKELNGHIQNVKVAQSNNNVLNYSIDTKASIANDLGIKFTYMIQDDLIFMSNFDIVTIIGNLLDNAIEAQSIVENKWLSMVISNTGHACMIKIENACDEITIQKDKEKIITSKKNKENHGIGIQCVENCIKKYKGELNVHIHDQTFTVELLFPTFTVRNKS